MTVRVICCSHSPLMLSVYQPADASAEKDVRSSFERMAKWVHEFDPELIVIFGPDHFNGFFYELMPSFCVGVCAEGTIDWNIKPGTLNVPKQIATECIDAIHAEDIDVAISWRMTVDHGVTIPLNYLTGALNKYPVLPIFINCIAPPLPSFRRCRQLGEAVGKYLATLGKRILVIGSGGLSHDPPTPRLSEASEGEREKLINARRLAKKEYDERQSRIVRLTGEMLEGRGPILPPNSNWDRMILARLEAKDLRWFDHLNDEEVNRVGGHGAGEVRCWVAAFATLATSSDYSTVLDCYRLVPEWITGMGIMRGVQTSEF